MAMTVQVDLRPSGRIHVVIHTDAAYNPDAAEDMVNRAAALLGQTFANVTADYLTEDAEDGQPE